MSRRLYFFRMFPLLIFFAQHRGSQNAHVLHFRLAFTSWVRPALSAGARALLEGAAEQRGVWRGQEGAWGVPSILQFCSRSRVPVPSGVAAGPSSKLCPARALAGPALFRLQPTSPAGLLVPWFLLPGGLQDFLSRVERCGPFKADTRFDSRLRKK